MEAGQRPSVARSYKSRWCPWGGQACLICPWVSNSHRKPDKFFFTPLWVSDLGTVSNERAFGFWVFLKTQITITWERKENIRENILQRIKI